MNNVNTKSQISADRVQIEKKAFVEGPLLSCIRAANCGVLCLTYHAGPTFTGGLLESVTIGFDGGGERHVDVTGDSLVAIIADVLKGVR